MYVYFLSKADAAGRARHVRFSLKADIRASTDIRKTPERNHALIKLRVFNRNVFGPFYRCLG